ncbi:MAG: tetratricopeptide repeat protein [Haliscomenobacter sp.]|nr:tetratricopeptide repeat protein [Haliscomenobacter sp.]MBK7475167.1 tetratricopeptide repeat protein [Haliscomenobacter sp.]MBK8879708.1 tetratricopeptide repeat protein [Haliscomenobacter sp.]
MTKPQLIVIGISIVSTLAIYLGCETVPKSFKNLEKSRSFSVEQTDIQVLLQEAKSRHPQAQLLVLEEMQHGLENPGPDSNRIEILKQLSGQWFGLKEYAIAGFYASQIAEIAPSGESWSIAGATYAIGLQQSQEESISGFCAKRAIQAFENAISLEPAELTHKINLALVLTDRPPEDNPMKGIQMLLDLNQNNPDQPGVLFHLGRLAMRTGQFDKAAERLEKTVSLDPARSEAFCLLAQAYQELGQPGKAAEAQKKCENNPL